MPPIPTSGAGSAEPPQQAVPEWARAYGRQVGQGVRRFESSLANWRSEGREWLKLGRNFWREIQEPAGRQRHMLTLVALAVGAGLVVGLATGRRREG